jgi:hypothetical protein
MRDEYVTQIQRMQGNDQASKLMKENYKETTKNTK